MKQRVIVYAFHTFESGGGFDWAPDTRGNRIALMDTLLTDKKHGNYDSGTLVSLSIAEYNGDLEAVTDFFEGELQDAIEVGAVGHILGRFELEDD